MVKRVVESRNLSNLLSQDYVSIRDHAAIFGNRTAALVSARGEVDWGCFPNMDSDPVFFSILDKDVGGRFSICPKVYNAHVSQCYYDGTSVLKTEFSDAGMKILSITDFLPISEQPEVYFSEVHRMIKADSDIKVDIVFEPFGRVAGKRMRSELGKGYMVEYKNRSEYLATDLPLKESEYGFFGKLELKAGDEKHLVAAYDVRSLYGLSAFSTKQRLTETKNYWKQWISKINYRGAYSDMVRRSAMTLNGMFFAPTGLMYAAPSASLPESIGGVRNWDYRYAWVRDTAYVIEVMVKLGYRNAAARFLYSMMDRIEREGKIQTIYSLSKHGMVKETVEKLDGYMGSKPVRFGNAASKQLQIDQYAAIINAVYIFMKNGGIVNLHMWGILQDVVTKILKLWNKPDNSIWEIRGRRQNYVYSKALSWKAVRDAAEIAAALKIKNKFVDMAKYTERAIRISIDRHGIDPNDGFYTQYYGSKSIDAALLRLPLIGYCKVNSKVFKETLKQVESRLMKEDFLFDRYDSDDGMGEDNAFLLLTFWYIQDLILIGDTKRARKGLIKLMGMINDVGLLPEEIAFGSHEYMGNYPQALSHLGLISTIISYSKRHVNV